MLPSAVGKLLPSLLQNTKALSQQGIRTHDSQVEGIKKSLPHGLTAMGWAFLVFGLSSSRSQIEQHRIQKETRMRHLAVFQGAPDFAVAAKIFYSLPNSLREGLNRSEEKCLIWTLFLSWYTGARGGKGSLYATFSEAWVASRFGRSRWTAARALGKLQDLGLIVITRRSPRPGMIYQTNLYRLGARLLAALGLKTAQVPGNIPCSTSAPQQFRKKSIRPATPSQGVVAGSEGKGEDLPLTPKNAHAETFEEFNERIRRNYTARPHPLG